MRTVISELQVDKYIVLTLDGPVPIKAHRKYRIAGKDYDIVPMYDMPNGIAIAAEGSFVGEVVEFI